MTLSLVVVTKSYSVFCIADTLSRIELQYVYLFSSPIARRERPLKRNHFGTGTGTAAVGRMPPVQREGPPRTATTLSAQR